MTARQGFELHPGAAPDITSIWEFIAEDSLDAATRVRQDILDAIHRLVPFPRQGHHRGSHFTSASLLDGTQLPHRLCTR